MATTLPPREATPRLLTRPFVLLSLAELAYFAGTGVTVYALPLYVTGPVGSDAAGAGLAFGAFAVTALVLRPFSGRLCDTRGRRPMLLGGALLFAASSVLSAHVDALSLVVALRLLVGVAEAAFFVAAMAALADLAPPSRMGEALSYNSLGLYLGLTLGPPLGELLVERWSFTAAWYGAAALAVVAAVVATRIGETRQDAPTAGHGGLIHWKGVPAGLGFFTSIVAMGGFLAFAALHADAVGLRNASLPLFTYGVVVVTCRIVFAKVPDRVPPLPLGAAALATMGTGLAVMTLWPTPTGLIGGTVLLAVGITFSTPAFFSAIFATAGPAERGAAAGTASGMLDLGIGVGPVLLGLVANAAGIPWAFAAAAAVAAAGATWTALIARQRRP